MKDSLVKAIAVFVMLILASCGNNPQAKPLPGINISSENINTFIKLRDTPVLANSHQNDDTLTLQLINVSDKTIIFSDNFGLKVFMEDKGTWTEIQNDFYNVGGTFTLPTEKLYPGGLLPAVSPYIPGLSSPTTVRVIIIGHIENNESEQVGAYLDVVINP